MLTNSTHNQQKRKVDILTIISPLSFDRRWFFPVVLLMRSPA